MYIFRNIISFVTQVMKRPLSPMPLKLFVTCLYLWLLVACKDANRNKSTPVPINERITKPQVELPSANTPQPANVSSTPVLSNKVNAPEKQTVVFAVYSWQINTYQSLIKTFEDENSDIQIKLTSFEDILGIDSFGNQEWPKNANHQLVWAADVLHKYLNPQDVANGLLLDLRPFIAAENNFDLADFYTVALSANEIDDGLWGLPSNINFQLLFYNKDLFDAASHPYPQAGWTWSEFLSTAQALTIRKENETIQWGYVEPWLSPYIFIWPLSGPLIDTTTDLPTPHFNDLAVIEAVRWYSDLHLRHKVTPYFPEELTEDGHQLFPGFKLVNDGRAAMWFGWSGGYSWQKSQHNIGVLPLPVTAPSDKSNMIQSDSYTISAYSQNPGAAWRWISYLSSKDVTNEYYDEWDMLPARRSVTQSGEFWSKVDPELGKALRYAVDHAYIPNYAFSSIMYDAIITILEGNATIEEALDLAQEATETAVANKDKLSVDAIPMPTFEANKP